MFDLGGSLGCPVMKDANPTKIATLRTNDKKGNDI
jgi:hypothetical protein